MGILRDKNGNVVKEFEGNIFEKPFLCVYAKAEPRFSKGHDAIIRELVGDIKAYVRFRVRDDVTEEIEGEATAIASRQMIEWMGITEDELWAEAIRNTPGRENNLFKEYSALSGAPLPECFTLPPIFCIKSREHEYGGAGVLANIDYLNEFREKHGDFYIIPSSIHELIAIEKTYIDEKNDEDFINNTLMMIKEVNETVVAPDEVLGDQLMLFDDTGLHTA